MQKYVKMSITQNNKLAPQSIARALEIAQPNTMGEILQPLDFEYNLWQKIKDSIKPHLYGTMPKIVAATFDRETKSQFDYRKKVYRSKSHYLLMQSIQDIYKIAQSDDFVVDFDNTLEQLLNRVRFGRDFIGRGVKSVFGTIYKDRVLDPNGYVGIIPQNYQTGTSGLKEYSLKIYPSETICASSNDLLAFQIGNNKYRIYTRLATFIIDGQGNILGDVFRHNGNDLGCYILGGVSMDIEIDTQNVASSTLALEPTKVIEVQMSDYSYAVDELDRLENRNSQNEVITNLHVHPRMVARDIGCDTCDGTGQTFSLDSNGLPLNEIINAGTSNEYSVPIQHKCSKCNGKGVLDIGVQDVITVPMPTGSDMTEGKAASLQDLGNSVLAYITPEITSGKFLYEQLNDSISNAKEMLRLQRFEDFGESGAAKRIDQEAGQPRLRAIAEGLQTLIKNIMVGVLNFEYIDTMRSSLKQTALSSITVAIPSFFDLITVGESKQMYFENMDKKPLFERYLEQKKIIKKQYSSIRESKIFDIAYFYTNGANLLMQSELINYQSIGVLTAEGIFIAAFIDRFIRAVLAKAAEAMQPIDFENISTEDFAVLLDKEIEPMLEKMRAEKQTQLAAMQALNTLPMDNTN